MHMNLMPRQETVYFAWPTAPASGAIAVIFNSETAFGKGMMRMLDLTMIRVCYLRLSHASGVSGLIAYAKYKAETPATAVTWRKLTLPTSTVAIPTITETATMPVTIAALSGDDNHLLSFDTSPYAEFKLEHTNSANTLTEWEGTTTGIFHGSAVQT